MNEPTFYDYKKYIDLNDKEKKYIGDKRRKEYHELRRNIIRFEDEIYNVSWYYIIKYNIKYDIKYYNSLKDLE
jgi:hypothetical protein